MFKDLERRLAYQREYYQKNKTKKGEYYSANRQQKMRQIEDARIRRLYGTTLTAFETYCTNINNCCEICGKMVDRLHVDHDHKHKSFRGALCRLCNIGLGSYDDNPSLLRAAALYLEAKKC